MDEIIITSQKDWDSLPEKFEKYTRIVIQSSGWIDVDKSRGNSSVEAWGNSSVVAWGNSSVEAWGNSSVEAWGNSSVVAYENASVVAYKNASVVAWGNSSVEAWGNSSVVAWGNSSVEAWGYVNVDVKGTKKPKLHHKARIVQYPKTPKQFCSFWGVEVVDKKYCILYKAVDKNLMDFKTGFICYKVGEKVSAPDFIDNWDCEFGKGLHLCFSKASCIPCIPLSKKKTARFLKCKVKLKDIRVYKGNTDFPEKVRCKEVVVLEEVF